MGMKIISIPYLRRPGEAVGFTARIPGIDAASTENAILFDADCQIPNATALLDWYVEQFQAGAKLAYTHVDYYGYPDLLPVKIRLFVHHISRWTKRIFLRVPTNRGSNYAVNRTLTLDLYERGLLADEMNVGPAMKSVGGIIRYSGSKDLIVYTSGRYFRPGWKYLFRYFFHRIRYNIRVLPVRDNVAQYTDPKW
jgi:hypothetical protein